MKANHSILTYLKIAYYFIASAWTAICLYGIYDTAINPTDPYAYTLSPLKMGFGFTLTALIAWLPLLIVWLRRNNPKTATLEQTFERVGREFYTDTQPQNKRPSVTVEDDEYEEDRSSKPRQ